MITRTSSQPKSGNYTAFLFLPKKRNARKEKTLRLHFSPGCSLRQDCDNPQTRFAQTGVATAALPPQSASPARNDKAGFFKTIAAFSCLLLSQRSLLCNITRCIAASFFSCCRFACCCATFLTLAALLPSLRLPFAVIAGLTRNLLARRLRGRSILRVPKVKPAVTTYLIAVLIMCSRADGLTD